MSTQHNWKLLKRSPERGVDWPPSWQRALVAALIALPSLTPEEFRATTSKVQGGLKRARVEQLKGKAAAVSRGCNELD